MAPEFLNIDVTVLRASQLPDLKREFYVVVDDEGSSKKGRKTKARRSEGNIVHWNEKLDGIVVQHSSQIAFCLYSKHTIRSDDLIGTATIDPISKTEATLVIATQSSMPHPTIVVTVHLHDNQRILPHSNSLAQSAVKEGNPMQLVSTDPGYDSQHGNDLGTPFSDIQTHLSLEEKMQAAGKTNDNADHAVENMHVLNDWKGMTKNIEWLMGMVGNFADIHPVAELAWRMISPIPQAFLTQFEVDEHVQDLVKSMRSAVDLTNHEDLLKLLKPNSNQAFILKVMLTHILTCGETVQCYAKDSKFRKRFLSNLISGTGDKINDLKETLEKLRKDFLDNTNIDTQTTVHDIQKSAELLLNDTSDMAIDVRMNDLPYDSGWSSTKNKNRCLEGTRVEFIDHITKWINDPSGPRGVILYGQLGTGKSTIAYEIACRFYFEGSYFSFSRAKKSTQKDHHLLTTIICDIAYRNPAFKRQMGELIKDNRSLRTSDDINHLFNKLLLEPLQKISTNETSAITVIVIDALDESEDPRTLSRFLSQFIAKLPLNFRVLVTSRPESVILPSFPRENQRDYNILYMTDSTLSADIHNDILLYFQAALPALVFEEHGKALTREAGGLFQWAAVACGYIKEPPAGYTKNDCLRGLLGHEGGDKQYTQELQSTKLYKLYGEILSGYFTSKITRPRFCTVMGQLLCAFEPLSIAALTNLRQFVPAGERDEDSVLAVLKFMGSLLSNAVSRDRDLPISPLHISFRDFLIDTENKHLFSVNLPVAHEELTYACLDLMLNDLSFNICRLESSHLRNSEVGDLQSRIATFISPALFYACRFWDEHLGQVGLEERLLDRLEQLFTTKFLFWLEVLSVTKTVPLGVQAINLLVKWLQRCPESKFSSRLQSFIDVVTDGRTFLRSFGTAIATSAPHIYVSALSFAPRSSFVHRIYSSIYPPSLIFTQGQLNHWPTLEMFMTASHYILCVDVSPDGEWIASSLENGTICMWNTTTGILEERLLVGHTDAVNSLAFSPDGQQIASGSSDSTICLWDVATGTMRGDPWVGHENTVWSVAFSPNGHYVVSGSLDRSIQVWNASSGTASRTPVYGHSDSVSSVVFSPNSDRILSGSDDCTVQVWKFHVENEVVQVTPLLILRTPDKVLSVAISPNGQQIAAGCKDNNIYTWDNPSKTMESVPLVGHTGCICDVKFFPDGHRLVSGSDDSKLIIWDMATKTITGNPLLGHAWTVVSVAVSADGQRIISGSYDSRIGVWNADAVQHTLGSTDPIAYDQPVDCVAFLPIGAQYLIAAGMDDGTLCLWDAATGDIIGGPSSDPSTGHTSAISAIAFSPNRRLAATASYDRTVRLWSITNNGASGVSTFATGFPTSATAVAFSPNGQLIVSGSYDGEVRVWNTSTRAPEGGSLSGCSWPVWSICFSPDSRQVVAGSVNNTIWVWNILEDTPDGQQWKIDDHGTVCLVAFLRDGKKLISCSDNGIVRFWNSSTGELDGTPFRIPCGEISSFALSTDGFLLAAASWYDFSVTVWNLRTRTKVNSYPLAGHADRLLPSALAFSPDGQQLISGSKDSTIRTWNLSIAATASAETVFDINWTTLDNEGWACGPDGELLLWVPQVHRSTFRRPSTTTRIIASNQTHIDFSNVAHGKEWSRPYDRNSIYTR